MKNNLLFVSLIITALCNRGSSQGQPAACNSSISLGIITGTSEIDVDDTLDDPVPVCIRCAALVGLSVQLFTDTSNVEYQDSNGVALVNNTNGIIITEYGLLINDPASSFTDEESIVCAFSDGTNNLEYQIAFNILIFNSPPITPNVSVVDFVEGVNASLICTGDPAIDTDRYQWLLPDGTVFPENRAVADNGLVLLLNSITRAQSGVYTCMGTLVGSQSERDSSITVNVQYPAKILSFTPGDTTLTVGSTLTLNCTFEGNPDVTSVSWNHNGTELDVLSDPNYSETIAVGNYSLLDITFANISFGGEYACGVNNTIGIDLSDFTFITVQVAPGPVYNLTNTSSTQTCVSLNWTFGFDGNSPITGVDISYEATDNFEPAHSDSTSTNTKEQTSITICNLQPLTTYEFTVTVRNEVSDTVGVSSPQTVSADTLPLVPGAPTLDSVNAVNSTALRVQWSDNFNPKEQSPIEGYEVFYSAVDSSDTDSVRVNDGDATMVDIAGLAKGTRYSMTVVAGNSAGMSGSSNAVTARTDIDPPGPVQNLVLTPNPFSICAAWSEPLDDGGQDVVSYKIDIWNRDLYQMENFTFVTEVGTAVLTYTIEGLLNNTEYSVQVTANNAANGEGGLGTSADMMTTTTRELVVDPEFNVSINGDPTAISVHVSWVVGSGEENVDFRLQIVEEDESFDPNEYTTYRPNVTYAIVDGLDPNTTYRFRMIRTAASGCTRRISNTVYFETQELEVEIQAPPNVTVGSEFVRLECRLPTGEFAPEVTWSRVDGELPSRAEPMGAVLTISDPMEADSGSYACTSLAGTPDEATFTFELVVLPAPTIPSPSSSIIPSPPTKEPVSTPFPVWAIAIIAVFAFICILIFVIVLILFIYFCCRQGSTETPKKARYDLGKPAGKKDNMWLDEGAGGFSAIPQFTGADDDSAPVNRGRTMTNDYASATSFNTMEKQGSKERLTSIPDDGEGEVDKKQTDV